MNEYCICVNLRYVASVPDGTDATEWLESHKDEVLDSMRSRLDSGKCRFVFESNWGDLIDYDIYCD